MKHLNRYKDFIKTNESLKSWLSTFLLLASFGLVPLNVKSADAETKKEFVENQPQDKIDAVKFVKYLDKNGFSRPINDVWNDFILSDKTVKSSYSDVQKYINRDGKVYHIDSKFKAQDFKNVDIHKFTPVNWTTDMGNFFPDSLEPNINNWIADYESKTSIEIGIVTVESLEGEPIEYFADDIYKRIGIGKKGADNGILIIFSKKDRKSRIQTGYGMDQFLNTTKCNRILTNIIRPNFKKEKYYEGMMAALLAIESELGDEAFSKKTEWLKEKTEKEQREHAKSVQAFWDFLLSALILSAILSPFVFIVYKRYKSRKVLEAIDKAIKSLKLIESKIPTKESINSNTLSEMIVSLNNLYAKINSSMKKENNITNEEHLEILKNYEELLNSNISKYESKKSYVLKSTQDIKSWEYISSKAKQDLENAIKAYDIVKSYGYDTTKPLNVEQIENVKHLGKKSFDLISSDIDKAINNFDNFRIQVQSIVSSGHKSISLFNSIKTAEYDISKHEQLIKSALDDMYKFKKWAKYSEESDIISKVKTYKPTTVKSDILSNHSLLKDILNTIEEVKRKWKRRKEDEEAAIKRAIEEKEAEERRRSYDDNSSSSSSYSSSFSGFGGGDSGSSGSSSDW